MLSLRNKLFLAFSGLFAILLLVAWLGMVVIERVSLSFDRIFRENLTSIKACQSLREAAEEMNQFLLVDLWEGGHPDTSVIRYHEREFERHLRFQEGNVTLEGERRNTDSLGSAWREFRVRYFELISSPAPIAIRRARYDSLLRQPYKDIQRLTRSIADLNSRNILSTDGQVRAQARDARRTMILLLSSGGILVLLFLLVLGRFILRPIRILTRSVQEIEKGNLDLALEVRSRDELGQLAEAFNAMTARLREFRRSDHARLVRTQKTTQSAINSLPDAVAVLGPDGTVEMSNDTAARHFGIHPGTRADSLGHPWLGPLLGKVSREERPFHPQTYESALQVFLDGQERFFLPHAIPLLDEAKHLAGVTLVLADVTELRRLDETKSDLLSTVSHELKTRLTSIRMAVHLLLDENVGDLNNRQTELLIAAREDSEHLHRIIEGLLDIGRIRSGQFQMEQRPMEAGEMVLHAEEAFRHAFQDKGIRYSRELPPDLPKVLADSIRAPLVLGNLLSNAFKFTAAGGEVVVRAEAEADCVRFEVRDTGTGIPEEELPFIFGRFYRGSQDDHRGGAGLGLAIAKEIVEAHGGSIQASSRPGEGSIFSFTLRRADADTPAKAGKP